MSFAMFVIAVFLPVLALPLMLLFPLPFAILSLERGMSAALASGGVVALFIAGALAAPLQAIAFFLLFCLAGSLLGLALRRAESGGDVLLAGVMASVCCKLCVIFLIAYLTGVNLLSPDAATMERSIDIFASYGLFSDAAIPREEMVRAVEHEIFLMPHKILLLCAVEVLLCSLAASRIHGKRTGEILFALPPLGLWRFPKNILIALLLGIFLELIATHNEGMEVVLQAGENLGAVIRSLFVLQGLSVTWYFMEIRAWPRFAGIAVLLSAVLPFFGDIFSIVGVLDIGFDLRKRTGGTHG
jgi:Predicted membrane protein